MRALTLGVLILVAGSAFEYVTEGSHWYWQARAESREISLEARERAREAREMAREQIMAKREAARTRLDFARARRDFLREQGRIRREAIREMDREFRHAWDRVN